MDCPTRSPVAFSTNRLTVDQSVSRSVDQLTGRSPDHSANKSLLEIFGGVSNLFNTQYATFGILGSNNLSNGSAEQFRGIAAPRAFYAGLHAWF